MTAATLYDTDADFRALIQCWIDNRHCPLPLADYLRESDLEGQAEAAEWAALKPEAEVWDIDRTVSGVYPQGRYWFTCENGNFADTVPEELLEGRSFTDGFATHELALLWLLDRWAEVAAQGVELPKAKVGQVQCV